MNNYHESIECPLTIVIPVYNRAELVAATLQCVEKQTLRPLNVVLVDNNSTDNSLQVLRDWKTSVETSDFHVTVVEETTPGAAAARNRGLQEVATPFTMFFDSDDLMAPTHCQRAVEALRKYADADIVGWDCRYIAPSGKTQKVGFYSNDTRWNNIFHGGMSTQRYAARTEIFHRCGGWDADCRGWDDVEMGFRILNLSPKIIKLKGDYTVDIIGGADSITGLKFSAKADVWEHALDLMAENVNSKAYHRMINFRRAILAGDYLKENAEADARRLISVVQAKERCPFYRALNSMAYHFRGLGFPGISRILRPFFFHL
jgi:glycosyltransferase involved in cell wall biosynthesis